MRKWLIILSLINFLCCSEERHDYATELIKKVEMYKKEKGKLPLTVEDIGITEKLDSPAFYKKESDSTYIIWYGTKLGESTTYYSIDKRWKFNSFKINR